MAERAHDVLVIGAGPAGLAAAATAAGAGLDVGVYDLQDEPGGQIWRGQWRAPRAAAARHWMTYFARSGARFSGGWRLVAAEAGRAHFDAGTVRAERVVIATGARELLLPFPGWTLPGVFGAGGLQALVKNGWPVRGKRVVVAGSGPLLLAVAASLREHGAEVRALVEQAPWSALARFAPALARNAGRVRQALALGRALRGVPYHAGTRIAAALGEDVLRGVVLQRGARRWQLDCDFLGAGFGLVPNLDVAQAFGCALADGAVQVDAEQRCSVPGVYCAGEGTGIGGVEQALAQGEIAGLALADRAAGATAARRRLRAAQRFAAALRARFAPRAEVLALGGDDTLLCRCENVPLGAVRACASLREAKLYHRLGMGHCQGRVCGAAAAALFGWSAPLPHPPLAPLRVGDFLSSPSHEQGCLS